MCFLTFSQYSHRGCFDEFNRISVEVLSVVAVQVKSVQDAIRDKKEIFNFMGEMIRCVPSVGIFITMVMCLFCIPSARSNSKKQYSK